MKPLIEWGATLLATALGISCLWLATHLSAHVCDPKPFLSTTILLLSLVLVKHIEANNERKATRNG